ncbi:MAG TPA: hypothetical protein PKE69_16390 [Pyrinomonadaceae bacterium]|nr:hypothetical protein [Pyrinomonadaceae bacterium]
MKAKIFVLTAILILFCASVFIEVGNAQTRRKKTTKPKATPTPFYSSNSVEIISLANQNDEQPKQNNTNNQSQDEKTVENDSQSNTMIAELNERISQLESKNKSSKEDKQKMLLLNLDILTRAEQRADSLRKQLFEIIEKQNTLKGRLDQINYDLTPDQIDRYSATIGTLRPELVREARKKTLENEKRNIESLLIQITTARTRLEQDVERADFMVDKLRVKLEKEIEDALEEK